MERDGRQQDIGRYTGYCYGKIRDLPARLAIRITMAESLSLSLSLSLDFSACWEYLVSSTRNFKT